jgi:hypothetical protein
VDAVPESQEGFLGGVVGRGVELTHIAVPREVDLLKGSYFDLDYWEHCADWARSASTYGWRRRIKRKGMKTESDGRRSSLSGEFGIVDVDGVST